MERDTDTISASEINRYTYCSFQWYYERVYGRKELNRRIKERNKEYAPKDTAEGNFKRGRRYHQEEYSRFRRKQLVCKIILILVLAGILTAFVLIRMR